MTKLELDQLTYKIIGAAIEVHKTLGPGLLESAYHKCMKHELTLRGIPFSSELSVNINYKGYQLEAGLRCDLLIDDKIVVELKATEDMVSIFETKLLTYMRLLEKPKGILINFNCKNLFDQGQWTYVNQFFRNLPSK